VRINHLAFSPDGKQLASWGNWLYFEDRLSLWDTATGKELRSAAVAEHRIAALSRGTQGFAVSGRATTTAAAWAPTSSGAFLTRPTRPPAPG
jgi:hypothetical protein